MLASKPSLVPVESDPPASRASGTVAPTLAILRLLSETSRPMGVNAIARELGLAPSSCFKILKQLQLADFADCDRETKCYSLGSGAILLARRALDPAQAFPLLRPRLAEVGERFSIAIGFWRCIPRSRIVLAGFLEGSNPMRIHMSIGQRLPMLMGGVGRAIAAELDLSEFELRTEFSRLRWQAPVTFEEYAAQVAEARAKGYAIDRNNFAPGVTTVATAIRDVDGVIGYGVSGIMFSGQHHDETAAEIGAALIEVADWASTRLIAGER